MKRSFNLSTFGLVLALGLTTAVFSSYGQNSSTYDEGVVINGVKWATRNVDKPGTFAAKPESAGMFYQWNRKKAWPATGKVSGWDDSTPGGTTWTKANDPSPAGWRVPTVDEIKKLLDTDKVSSVWTTRNGVKGRKFTDKTTGNSLFLPAAGCRGNGGALGYVGSHGAYWSSTVYGSNLACGLFFGSGSAGSYRYLRWDGRSIRPVADNSSSSATPNAPGGKTSSESQTPSASNNSLTSDKGVVINGVKWATCNVDKPGTFAAKPEDPGMFYQWNRKKGWPATGEVTGWDSSGAAGNTWAKANDPSPAGWRVPTEDEFKKLIDEDKVKNEWTSVNGVNGRRFTDKVSGNSIFLPAVSVRSYQDGTLDHYAVSQHGGYWSSTQHNSYDYEAYSLRFGVGNAFWGGTGRNQGISVRSVAD